MTIRGRTTKFPDAPQAARRRLAQRKSAAGRTSARVGAAAVELALVLPFLLAIFVVSVDFARIFYAAQVISDCARTTALFIANPDLADKTSLESAQMIARQCVKDLQPQPTIAFARGTDGQSHQYVEVTVSQDFKLICPFVFGSHYQLTRSARARLFPAALEESDSNG